MITIECNVCGESLKTRDVKKAVAFNQEHKDLHPEEALRAALTQDEGAAAINPPAVMAAPMKED